MTKFPGDKAALAAFLYMADLQESKKQYAEAVRSLNRLADMFKGDDAAVKALVDSAKIASGKMKNYELQIQVQSRLVDEYPNREEAVIALNSIAETNVKQLDKIADAINVYKALIKQYPDHKLGEWTSSSASSPPGGYSRLFITDALARILHESERHKHKARGMKLYQYTANAEKHSDCG